MWRCPLHVGVGLGGGGGGGGGALLPPPIMLALNLFNCCMQRNVASFPGPSLGPGNEAKRNVSVELELLSVDLPRCACADVSSESDDDSLMPLSAQER